MENYIVSARKYRPETFKSVVGQPSITTTLKNAIKIRQLAHAYLFCGPRGVGKTTCARIFAKTINCFNITENTEACNECESCLSFNSSRSFNIHELDAASNNSVEDIRSLIEQVRIPPQIAKYSIYIIDEVHMLSANAFNAFLKTLEEPPPHAIFILATTEKHKILPTILSRCQIFDFSRITIDDIANHIAQIARAENIEAESEGLNIIAQKADGAMRDALSIFDQIVSFSSGKVTYRNVIENLNVLDYDYYFKLTDALLSGNIPSVLMIFNEILARGFDGHNFVNGLSRHFRDLLVCHDEVTLQLLEVGVAIREKYRSQSKLCSAGFLINALSLTNQCDLSYRSSRSHRLHVELCLVQLCGLNAGEKKKPDSAGNTLKENKPATENHPSGRTSEGNQSAAKVPEGKQSEVEASKQKEGPAETLTLAAKQSQAETLAAKQGQAEAVAEKPGQENDPAEMQSTAENPAGNQGTVEPQSAKQSQAETSSSNLNLEESPAEKEGLLKPATKPQGADEPSRKIWGQDETLAANQGADEPSRKIWGQDETLAAKQTQAETLAAKQRQAEAAAEKPGQVNDPAEMQSTAENPAGNQGTVEPQSAKQSQAETSSSNLNLEESPTKKPVSGSPFPNTISIKDVMNGNISSPVSEIEDDLFQLDDSESADNVQEAAEDFTEKDLADSWKKFANQIRNKHPRLYNTLLANKPSIFSQTKIEFELSNPLQEEALNKIKPELVKHLKRELNPNMELVFTVNETVKEDRLYLPEEKFDHLVKKNPNLAILKQKFNLDFE